MSSFRERKAARTEFYHRYVYGRKLVTCGACAGSGRYDYNGNPPCSWCKGTGKTLEEPRTNKSEPEKD